MGSCPRIATALGAAAVLAVTAGCVSMPNGGPVLPYAVSPSGNGQAQPYLQIVPQPPIPNAEPADIVRGFLAASASFAGQQHVAREYLTPQASRAWQPGWSAIVFRDGPNVQHLVSATISPSANEKLSGSPSATPRPARSPTAPSARAANTRVTVTVGGAVEASLTGSGTYAVPRPTPKGRSTYSYDVVMYHGQWRISRAPSTLLLTHTEFDADYQLRNLYFFDPSGQHLVPDPVYVPLQATQEDLVNGLVQDLITQPPDWLANGATQTAFPKGTRQLGKVTVDGNTASVNLGGAIAHSRTAVKQQVSAQLLWTLNGAGQGAQEVQSVALYVNGSPFVPPNAQGNPVQGIRSPAHDAYEPIVGPPGNDFYYLDSHGQLLHKSGLSAVKPALIARIGTGYRSLAVSPDREYFAALRDGVVYTAPMVGSGKPTLRDAGGGFTSLSWDRNDNLWAAGPANVVMLPAVPAPRAGSSPVVVAQYQTCPGSTGGVTQLRVAPDGVRVALVIAGQEPMLAFGAIVTQDQSRAGQPQSMVRVSLSPFFVCGPAPGAFRSLTWYGGDNVIALGQDGTTLTEYPVNGGTQTTIHGKAGTQSITARIGAEAGVIAGVGDTMFIDPSAAGAWNAVGAGLSPAYPG